MFGDPRDCGDIRFGERLPDEIELDWKSSFGEACDGGRELSLSLGVYE